MLLILIFLSLGCNLVSWSELNKKKLWDILLCFSIPGCVEGNQHGGCEYDDLQNWFDMTSHENPWQYTWVSQVCWEYESVMHNTEHTSHSSGSWVVAMEKLYQSQASAWCTRAMHIKYTLFVKGKYYWTKMFLEHGLSSYFISYSPVKCYVIILCYQVYQITLCLSWTTIKLITTQNQWSTDA